MLTRQLERTARGGQVVARHQQPLDAGRGGSGQHLVPIGVEGWILQMAVRVDQPGQRRRPAWAQDGTSTAASSGSSTRGKSGTGSPTCSPSVPPPQAAASARRWPPVVGHAQLLVEPPR